jgi:hypothetical protein
MKEFENEENERNEGLETGLKPTKVNLSPPRAGDEIELFLQDLGNRLLKETLEYNNQKVSCPRSKTIKKIQKMLIDRKDKMVIPTDKTNCIK